MKILDEVMTSDGRALIVGFPSDRHVEVRLLDQVGILVLDRDHVTEIASDEAAQKHKLAKDQGVNLTVPEEVKEFEEQGVVDHPEDPPRSPKTGRRLTGAALANHRKNHPNDA